MGNFVYGSCLPVESDREAEHTGFFYLKLQAAVSIWTAFVVARQPQLNNS